MIIEATLEASRAGILRGCKDLGGGGLATGLSEIADKGGTGLEVYLEKIPIRESDMNPIEIMISESQERMLLVVKEGHEPTLLGIMRKYGVSFARIAAVTSTGKVSIVRSGTVIADLPTRFLANAPIIHRIGKPPHFSNQGSEPCPSQGFEALFLNLLSSPTITSKEWVYSQYDHEVGIRTIAKPGESDAAVLEDCLTGNSPRSKLTVTHGFVIWTLTSAVRVCLRSACRNVVAVGAEPIAFLDHCQFGDPNDEEIFGAFSMTVKGIADFACSLLCPASVVK